APSISIKYGHVHRPGAGVEASVRTTGLAPSSRCRRWPGRERL
ncbi:MAG: hypothetical protein AVDCRST_MAG29-1467, partial [uncultured Nocardioidaceae bacterium]